jgi:hypothetical protein
MGDVLQPSRRLAAGHYGKVAQRLPAVLGEHVDSEVLLRLATERTDFLALSPDKGEQISFSLELGLGFGSGSVLVGPYAGPGKLNVWGSGRLEVNGGRVAVSQMFILLFRPEALSARRAGLHERAVHTTDGFGNCDFAGYVADSWSPTPLLLFWRTFLLHEGCGCYIGGAAGLQGCRGFRIFENLLQMGERFS